MLDNEVTTGGGAIALSYSPPGAKQKRSSSAAFQKAPFSHHYTAEYEDRPRKPKAPLPRKPRHVSMKNQTNKRTYDYYGSNIRGVKNKNAVRFDYNNAVQKKEPARTTRYDHV